MFGLLGFPWIKAATYLAALAAGFALCVWVYAGPRLAAKDTEIAAMVASSEKNKTDFTEAVLRQKESYENAQHQVDLHNAQAATRLQTAVAAATADRDQLRNEVADYVGRHQGTGLPDATSGQCRSDDAAATLGDLLEQSDGLALELASEAERLADQVRYFQEREVRVIGARP